MLIKRTAEEVIKDAIDKIVANTPITNMYAGSIARSIVEALSGEYESLYQFAEDVLNQGYLSKADEEHLNLIGVLFNYPRRTEIVIDPTTGQQVEQLIDVETYRYELSQRVLTAVSSNEESLRLACLAIPGVQNIIGREYTFGAGSFSYILIVEYGFDPETVKADMEEAIAKTKAYGVKPAVILPVDVPIELKLQLLFHESVTENDKDRIRLNVKTKLYQYFGNFDLEQEFIYNDFVQEVMNVDQNILDFQVVEFYLNGVPALLTNQTVSEDERIRPKVIEIL